MSSDNLVNLADRTPEERSAIASKGGIASGESKRHKKALRELCSELLNSKLSDKEIDLAEALQIENVEGYNKGVLAFASCLREAIKSGNARDLEKIFSIAGELEEDSSGGGQQQSLIYLPEEDKSDGTESI